MQLSQVLRRISWLALLPGATTYAITMIGAKIHIPTETVRWCTMWWWVTLISGVMLFYLLRSIAALIHKVGAM